MEHHDAFRMHGTVKSGVHVDQHKRAATDDLVDRSSFDPVQQMAVWKMMQTEGSVTGTTKSSSGLNNSYPSGGANTADSSSSSSSNNVKSAPAFASSFGNSFVEFEYDQGSSWWSRGGQSLNGGIGSNDGGRDCDGPRFQGGVRSSPQLHHRDRGYEEGCRDPDPDTSSEGGRERSGGDRGKGGAVRAPPQLHELEPTSTSTGTFPGSNRSRKEMTSSPTSFLGFDLGALGSKPLPELSQRQEQAVSTFISGQLLNF